MALNDVSCKQFAEGVSGNSASKLIRRSFLAWQMSIDMTKVLRYGVHATFRS